MRIKVGYNPKIMRRRLCKQKYLMCALFGAAFSLALAYLLVLDAVGLYGLNHIQSYSGTLSGVDLNRQHNRHSGRRGYLINIDGKKFYYFGGGRDDSFKTLTQLHDYLETQICKTVRIRYAKKLVPSNALLSLETEDRTCIQFEGAFALEKD